MLLVAGLLFGSTLKAQNVLLSEDFELQSFYNKFDSVDVLPGNVLDTMWYRMDADYIPDASTTGTRPDGYFAIQPFSPVDRYPTIYGGTPPDSNTVIAANSWNNFGDDPQGLESNWMVTCNVKLGTHDTLFWKSAPFQTPRYCDGYEVLLSTTDNNDFSFTHVLFTASEMTGTPGTDPDTTYTDFTFSPASGFIHGFDGTYIDPAGTTAPVSHHGRLYPFSVPLDTYGNKNVFIAFHHNSHDDNLISFDDVMIRGDASNPNAGIEENHNVLGVAVYPNPASDYVQVNYILTADADAVISVYDVTGKLVSSQTNGTQSQGRHFAHINTSDLAKGFYTVNVKTATASSNTKLIVR